MATAITRQKSSRKRVAFAGYQMDAKQLPRLTATLGALLGTSIALAGVTIFSVILIALVLAGSVGFIMSHHH